MPRRGHSLPPHQRARHARALQAPLRRVVGAVQTGTYSNGDPLWREALECGHASALPIGQPADATPRAARGQRRRCLTCAPGARGDA